MKWPKTQNYEIVRIFNDLPFFHPKDSDVINEWITALNCYYDSYRGIQRALLNFETFDFASNTIMHIPAQGQVLKKYVKALDSEVVRCLKSEKFVDFDIDETTGGLKVANIWKNLLASNVNYTNVSNVRLSLMADYMYKYMYKNPHPERNERFRWYFAGYDGEFIKRSYDPTVKFLVQINYITLGIRYYLQSRKV